MAMADPRACACGARYGTPRPVDTLSLPGGRLLEMMPVDAVKAHLYICRCSGFIRLECGFGLISVFVLLESDE